MTPRLLSKRKIVTPLPARKVGGVRKKLPYKSKTSNVVVLESPKEEAAPHNMVDKSLSPPPSPLAVNESSYGNVLKKDMGHQAKAFQKQPETLINAVEAAVHPGVLKTKSLLSRVQLNSEERRMLSAMPKHPIKFGTARAVSASHVQHLHSLHGDEHHQSRRKSFDDHHPTPASEHEVESSAQQQNQIENHHEEGDHHKSSSLAKAKAPQLLEWHNHENANQQNHDPSEAVQPRELTHKENNIFVRKTTDDEGTGHVPKGQSTVDAVPSHDEALLGSEKHIAEIPDANKEIAVHRGEGSSHFNGMQDAEIQNPPMEGIMGEEDKRSSHEQRVVDNEEVPKDLGTAEHLEENLKENQHHSHLKQDLATSSAMLGTSADAGQAIKQPMDGQPKESLEVVKPPEMMPMDTKVSKGYEDAMQHPRQNNQENPTNVKKENKHAIVCNLGPVDLEHFEKLTKQSEWIKMGNSCTHVAVNAGQLKWTNEGIAIEASKGIEKVAKLVKEEQKLLASINFSSISSEDKAAMNQQMRNGGEKSTMISRWGPKLQRSSDRKKKTGPTRLEFIEKFLEQYVFNGFLLDFTGGFTSFDKYYADFLRDFLLELHSEKVRKIDEIKRNASGNKIAEARQLQRRLIVVRLDNVDREKLEQSKEFMNNLRYADLIILSGESAVGSLAEELSKKNGLRPKVVVSFPSSNKECHNLFMSTKRRRKRMVLENISNEELEGDNHSGDNEKQIVLKDDPVLSHKNEVNDSHQKPTYFLTENGQKALRFHRPNLMPSLGLGVTQNSVAPDNHDERQIVPYNGIENLIGQNMTTEQSPQRNLIRLPLDPMLLSLLDNVKEHFAGVELPLMIPFKMEGKCHYETNLDNIVLAKSKLE